MKVFFKWLYIFISVICISYVVLLTVALLNVSEEVECFTSRVIGSFSSDKEFEVRHSRVVCNNTPLINNQIHIVDRRSDSKYLIYEGYSHDNIEYGVHWIGTLSIDIIIPSYEEIYEDKRYPVEGYSITYRNALIPSPTTL